MDKKFQIFISYSHKDEKWLDRLSIHLKPIERDFNPNIWSDKKIKSGDNWQAEIRQAIKNCNLAILLISADFLASDFISTDELPPLLKAAKEKGIIIIPIIISPSLIAFHESLSIFQAVNDYSEPMISLNQYEQEKILLKVAEDVLFKTKEFKTTTPELVTLSKTTEPLENFIDNDNWIKLVKIGNWELNQKIITGLNVGNFLLSKNEYNLNQFSIDTEISFNDLKLFTERKDFMNSGIVFGHNLRQLLTSS
jgi:hypothetical protein